MYGLLFWSTFTRFGSQIQVLEAERSTPELEIALREFEKRRFPTSWERYKQAATTVLEQSLQHDPLSRSPVPWLAWDISLKLKIPPVVHRSVNMLNEMPHMVSSFIVNGATTFFQTSASKARRTCQPFLKPSDKRDVYMLEWEKFHGIRRNAVSEHPLDGDKDPYDISGFTHGEKCVDFSPLRRRLQDLIRQNSQEDQMEIYSLARLRSRVRLCCWERNCSNLLEMAIQAQPGLEMSALAWLARGEVGMYEVKELRPLRSVWCHILSPSKLMDESQCLDRFLLLLQFGARVEMKLTEHPPRQGFRERSIVVHYIQNCRPVIVPTVMEEIRRRFSEAREKGCIGPDTKDYFQISATLRPPNFLRDLARHLIPSAIECILSNETSNDVLSALSDEANASFKSTKKHSVETSRDYKEIQRLLKPRYTGNSLGVGGNVRRSESNPAQSLPLGWEEVVVRSTKRKSDPEIGRYYREEATGSLTLLRPHFSLYVVRQLILGMNGAKKVLYLDLNGFVNLNTVQEARRDWESILTDRFPSYNVDWFRVEAYKEHSQRDVLSEIKEDWRLPSLPSLPSFPRTGADEISSFEIRESFDPAFAHSRH